MWHSKAGEYCPEEGSVSGVVRFGEVDKVYIRTDFVSSAPTPVVADEPRTSYLWCRTVRSGSTTIFLLQDPDALAVLIEVVSDDLQQYISGVHYRRDTPAVTALCPILIFVEYYDDDGILLLLRHPTPLQMQTTISCSLHFRTGSPLRIILNCSKESLSDPTTIFPFANERMASVSSFIVG